ncbi:DUF4062 domain-containing protein [Hymenobacter weizhouensis]|uniref:DUF4062 domain-containing protein n=1 Tax=Hymenobacter sp. YIM 151500-1 TaxID=2987689 RepID=UPI002226FC7E|nr:DUF4062 domain-containing protein [Hymenobacter sp. YIM 151500-1]UYZ65337.1 DUF4062 domain-containing protein [Hymenobacter sp. YIM 151500-1]
MAKARRLNVMVSSSVYGNQNLLDRIYATLSVNYNVWMSHEGTVFVNSKVGNFANCIAAVEECDVFLGIITGNYGSGIEKKGEPSITHMEMRRALELEKQRCCLVHESVVLARQLLSPYRLDPEAGPFRKDADGNLHLIEWPRGNRVISDLQVLDLYEEMMRLDLPIAERTGNWVQTYRTDEDALRYIATQFGDVNRMRRAITGQ